MECGKENKIIELPFYSSFSIVLHDLPGEKKKRRVYMSSVTTFMLQTHNPSGTNLGERR